MSELEHCDEADPQDCLYETCSVPSDFTRYPEVGDIVLVDHDALEFPDRPIPVIVNIPEGRGPKPIVILSHGGPNGVTNPANVMERWFQELPTHGYVTVVVAHTPRDTATNEALCSSLGLVSQCPPSTVWDRPHDLATVIDWLEDEAADRSSPLYGKADPDRIAVLGHSAGAAGALTIGGATRIYGTRADDSPVVLAAPDPRVDIVVALSPPGRNTIGITDDSFSTVEIPALIMSSDGDLQDVPGVIGDRAQAYYMSNAEEQYLLYLATPAARHSTLNINPEDCVRFTDTDTCNLYVQLIVNTTLAFLEGYLDCDSDALEWLETDGVELASGGVVQFDKRAPEECH